MRKKRGLYGCPVELALDVLGGKWKTVILARIKHQPVRYSELRKAIPSLSDKMLTQRLGDLVDEGLICLEAGEDGKDRYAMTSYGRELAAPLQALYDWGARHGEVVGARYRSRGIAAE